MRHLNISGTALTLTVLFVLAMAAVLAHTIMGLESHAQDALLIDVAGRQRMLNERFLREALLTAQGVPRDYTATLDLLKSRAAALRDGGAVLLDRTTGASVIVPSAPTAEIAGILTQQADLLSRIAHAADAFLRISPEDPASSTRLALLLRSSADLQAAAEKTVALLEAHAATNISHMIMWEIAIGALVAFIALLFLWHARKKEEAVAREVAERRTSEHRLSVQYATAEALANANSVVEGVTTVLKLLCEHLDWPIAGYWRPDDSAGVLRNAAVWTTEESAFRAFIEVTRKTTFPHGVGLPGRVWSSGRAATINDVVVDPNFPRAQAAKTTGVHGAFAVPIFVEDACIGIMEFFHRERLTFPNEDLEMVSSLGRHIGLFLVRKEAESAVRSSQARLQGLLQTVDEAIISVDKDNRIILFNRAAERLFGYPFAEVEGERLDLLLPAGLASANGAHLPGLAPPRESASGNGERLHIVGRRKNGTEFRAEASISQLTLNGQATLTAIMRDVTERIAAEESLQQAYAETEQLLASISAIMVGVNDRGLVTRWNRVSETVFGLAASEAVGHQLGACGIQWDWAQVSRAIDGCRRTGRPVRLDEVRYTQQTGKEGFLSLTVSAITDGDQRAGSLLLGTDITQHKLLEGQLTLAQRMESIGQLAAGIAHEINTPMQYVSDNLRFLQEGFSTLQTVLTSYEGLLERSTGGTVSEAAVQEVKGVVSSADLGYLMDEIPKAIEQSLEGAGRVTRIVRAMKEFSHPGSGKKEAIDLNRAIESTITVARNEWKYVAEVVTDLDPDLPQVPGLPGELNQVILNLVVNAAQAIGDAVAAEPGKKGTITVSTRRKEDWVEVRVADTGPGIPESVRSKIFDPFFTTKEVGKGTGQGLAIAHDVVVTKHGGSLGFETEVGKGTTFKIRLPLHSEAVVS